MFFKMLFLLPLGLFAAAEVYVLNQNSEQISVIDTEDQTVVATLDAYGRCITFAPDGSKAYVCGANNTVLVIDTEKPTITDRIAVGNFPCGIAVSLDGKTAYVINKEDATLSVINTEKNAVTDTIVTVIDPKFIAINAKGDQAYIAGEFGDIGIIDLSSLSLIDIISLRGNVLSLGITPGGTKAVIGNISIRVFLIDTATYEVTSIPVITQSDTIAFTPDGRKAFAGTLNEDNHIAVIDMRDESVESSIEAGFMPKVAAAPNGTEMYVCNSGYLENSVSVIDVNTLKTVTTISVGEGPQMITFSSDGAYAYVINQQSNTVSVIDTARRRVIATIPVGRFPSVIATKASAR